MRHCHPPTQTLGTYYRNVVGVNRKVFLEKEHVVGGGVLESVVESTANGQLVRACATLRVDL